MVFVREKVLGRSGISIKKCITISPFNIENNDIKESACLESFDAHNSVLFSLDFQRFLQDLGLRKKRHFLPNRKCVNFKIVGLLFSFLPKVELDPLLLNSIN